MIQVRSGLTIGESGCGCCGLVVHPDHIHTVIKFAINTRARTGVNLCEECSQDLYEKLGYHLRTEPFPNEQRQPVRIVRKTIKRRVSR